MVRGKVTAKRLFRTSGKILTATVQEGRLRYVYHESGAYFREDAKNILRSELHRDVRLRIWGEKTVFARRGALVVLEPDNERQNFQTQMVGRLPVFAVNGRHLYRLQGDYLLRDDTLGDVTIGGILRDRTLIWAGDRFGLGFFRAGSLTRTFVFDAERTGINDTVPVPPMAGTLVDATCAFSNDMVWFMIAIQESNDLKHHCFVISRSGELLAHASAIQGDGTWLGDGIRGRLAIGNRLYAATDSGIVHIECQGKNLAEVRSFPDTEPFVSTDSQLFPSKEGIIVVSQQEIFLLQIR